MQKLLISTLILLLSGCQTAGNNQTVIRDSKTRSYSKKDTSNAVYNRYTKHNQRYTIKQDAPPAKQHALNFKEPTPTKEPLSRYGNPTEYQIEGRSYEVMKNTNGYKAIGVASWYGAKFHKQRTSSGEPYDMYVMTAAHKTLPLPTYIKVKNLDNGKEAIVKVNDRGPFHSDRIIDLSYAAAVKLGVFPKGTANVQIESMMGPSLQGHYYLQAGAFSSATTANLLKTKLAQLTSSPVIVEHYQQHYIVRVGPFGNKHLTEGLKAKLASNGVKDTFSVLI